MFCIAAFIRFDFASPGRSKTLSGYFSYSVFKNCGPFHQSVLIDLPYAHFSPYNLECGKF